MSALDRFVSWMSQFTYSDPNHKLPPGLKLQYHSRSDAHSQKLGELIVEDLLDTCVIFREHALRGQVAFSINYRFIWPYGKAKTLDLAIGVPRDDLGPPVGTRIHRLGSRLSGSPGANTRGNFSRLLIACEEKAVMTEHGKSQPRVFSELNDSHTIVHQGSRDTIAAGITMVNIAPDFVSPLRQRPDQPVVVSKHDQPSVTRRMVDHLRKLPVRQSVDKVGFDAYCTFVVDADNRGHVALHTEPPAPQPGDPDHYATFLERICRYYLERYKDLDALPEGSGMTIEESLIALAEEYPELLDRAASLAVREGLSGAEEFRALLRTLEKQTRSDNDV